MSCEHHHEQDHQHEEQAVKGEDPSVVELHVTQGSGPERKCQVALTSRTAIATQAPAISQQAATSIHSPHSSFICDLTVHESGKAPTINFLTPVTAKLSLEVIHLVGKDAR